MSQAEILDYLRKFGKGTIKDFIRYTGKSKSAAAIGVMKLKRHNEIRRIGWTIISGIKLALYSLNDKKLRML